MRKILLYIVYGDKEIYYDGAKFSILTFNNWTNERNKIEIVVLTEEPEKFANFPIKIIPITKKQKNEWSLQGKYHFRIKNRGLAFAMDYLKLENKDKILFFDTDTYFFKNPLPLFDLIQENQALFYLNEGLIHKRKRFKVYVDSLDGKVLNINNQEYKLSKSSALWGSLMIGIMPNMRPSLDWADMLMLKLHELVPAHTIEPFSLSESLLRKYKIVEGKEYVGLYSTSRKKEYAMNILSIFFKKNKFLDFNQLIRLAQSVKIRRPFYIVIKQRFIQFFEKNAKE